MIPKFLYENESQYGKWREKIDVMPESLSVPVMLPKKELQGLPKQVLLKVKEDNEELEERFKTFNYIVEVNLSSKLNRVKWKDFKYASTLIRSRWLCIGSDYTLNNID